MSFSAKTRQKTRELGEKVSRKLGFKVKNDEGKANISDISMWIDNRMGQAGTMEDLSNIIEIAGFTAQQLAAHPTLTGLNTRSRRYITPNEAKPDKVNTTNLAASNQPHLANSGVLNPAANKNLPNANNNVDNGAKPVDANTETVTDIVTTVSQADTDQTLETTQDYHNSQDKNSTHDEEEEEEEEEHLEEIEPSQTLNPFLKKNKQNKPPSKTEKKKEKKEENKKRLKEQQTKHQPSILLYVDTPNKPVKTKKSVNKDGTKKKTSQIPWEESEFINSTPQQSNTKDGQKKKSNKEKISTTSESAKADNSETNYERILGKLTEDYKEENEEALTK